MSLSDAISDISRWDIKILASDISTRVLAEATSGIYREGGIEKLQDMSQRHFLKGKGVQEGKVQLRPDLAKLVAFRRINLIDKLAHSKSPRCHFLSQCHDLFRSFHTSHPHGKVFQVSTTGGVFIYWTFGKFAVDRPSIYMLRPTIYQKPLGVTSET